MLFVEIEYGCTRVVWMYKCFLCCMCLLPARPCVLKERIKEAIEKIRLNKQLPYLVGSVVEVRGGYWHVTELHSARKYGSMSISNECDLALVRLYGVLRHLPCVRLRAHLYFCMQGGVCRWQGLAAATETSWTEIILHSAHACRICICVLQLFDNEEEGEEDGAATDIDLQRKGKCIVIKTSTRQVRE